MVGAIRNLLNVSDIHPLIVSAVCCASVDGSTERIWICFKPALVIWPFVVDLSDVLAMLLHHQRRASTLALVHTLWDNRKKKKFPSKDENIIADDSVISLLDNILLD